MSATQSHGRVYGFVDVDEGTQLWSRESPSDDSNALVASCNFRASYDVTNSDFVDLVVPGYGACKTRLGDSTQFTPDVTKLRPNEKRLCDELVLVFQDFGVTMDLLKLAFGGIRRLSIEVASKDDNQSVVDLSVLASVCPLLESLHTTNGDVVVSAHTEALSTWPIQDMAIWWTDAVSDLTACLRNPALRMTRHLVKLVVASKANRNFGEEVRELTAHDGDFLPVV